jgi:hypothetical protein
MVLGRLEASTTDSAYPGLEPLQTPPALRQRTAVSNGLTGREAPLVHVSVIDDRENQRRLSNLAQLLAYKVWYALSEGACAEFQPTSWRTICYFIRGLEALKRHQLDPGNTAAASEAIAYLRGIVEHIDPLYRPARFFLGIAYLNHGDCHEAQGHFERLMEPIDHAARAFLERLTTAWRAKRPRYSVLTFVVRIGHQLSTFNAPGRWLASQLPPFLEWHYLWYDVLLLLHRGVWYRLVADWKEFSKRIDHWRGVIEHTNHAAMDRLSGALQPFVDESIYPYVKMAVGLRLEHFLVKRLAHSSTNTWTRRPCTAWISGFP